MNTTAAVTPTIARTSVTRTVDAFYDFTGTRPTRTIKTISGKVVTFDVDRLSVTHITRDGKTETVVTFNGEGWFDTVRLRDGKTWGGRSALPEWAMALVAETA